MSRETSESALHSSDGVEGERSPAECAGSRSDTFRARRHEKWVKKQEAARTKTATSQPREAQPPWLRTVASADDAALDIFRDLKARPPSDIVTRKGLFIAEGPETISLLLDSEVQIVSLLFKDSAFASLRPKIEQAVAARSAAAATRAGDDGEQSPERTEPVFPEEGGGRRGAEAARSRAGEECSTSRPGVPFVVHVCAEKLLSQVVGFTHRGALAAGVVPPRDAAWLDRVVLQPLAADPGRGIRVLAVERSTDVANLGAMVRSAAAFGVDLVLLGPACCDAWYRRAVRCSMGHVFRVPVHRCAALPEALRRLEEGFGVAAFAAVIDAEAPALGGLRSVPARWCLVVGNEQDGISAEARAACGGGGVRIEMAPGVDSLNVGVATAVLLNGLREREQRRREPRGEEEVAAVAAQGPQER